LRIIKFAGLPIPCWNSGFSADSPRLQ